MLAAQGLLAANDLTAIERGLATIEREIDERPIHAGRSTLRMCISISSDG